MNRTGIRVLGALASLPAAGSVILAVPHAAESPLALFPGVLATAVGVRLACGVGLWSSRPEETFGGAREYAERLSASPPPPAVSVSGSWLPPDAGGSR